MSHGEHGKAAKTEHTPEPWRVELVNHALGDTGDYEGVVEIRSGDAKRPMIEIWDDSDEAEANARRIVACVNACAGIKTEDLEAMRGTSILTKANASFDEVQKQRDELMAALDEAIDAVRVFHGPVEWETYRDHSPEMKRWQAAIAGAKGKE